MQSVTVESLFIKNNDVFSLELTRPNSVLLASWLFTRMSKETLDYWASGHRRPTALSFYCHHKALMVVFWSIYRESRQLCTSCGLSWIVYTSFWLAPACNSRSTIGNIHRLVLHYPAQSSWLPSSYSMSHQSFECRSTCRIYEKKTFSIFRGRIFFHRCLVHR